MLSNPMIFYSLTIGISLLLCVSNGNRYNIAGTTERGWEFVRELFEENFIEKRDLGASLAMYHQGRLVVNLWGGWFDENYKKPYDNKTLQLVFSTTKGLVAVAAALCVQKGLLDYSALVTKYWPEYGQNGKENTTVADILSHRAGLPNDSLSFDQYVNWTAMVHSLEEQRPIWPPGTAHGYHALTYGWLAGELIRRVDPKRRTLGQFIQEEIAKKLNIEFYVGLPYEQKDRVSPLVLSPYDLQTADEASKALYYAFNDYHVHRAEIPAGNGITNARSLARLYASLIGNLNDKKQTKLLKDSILKQAIKSNTPQGEVDLTFRETPTVFGMGFWLFDDSYPIPGSTAFGHAGHLYSARFFRFLYPCFCMIGAGGSFGFAVPSKKFSFGYVMNQFSTATTNGSNPRLTSILEKVAKKLNHKSTI